MKEHSHKSHKHIKDSHSKRHNGNNRPEPDKHRNVLKERPYKDVLEPKRSEKSRHDNTKSHSKKDRSRSSNNHQDHQKPDVFSSSGRSEDEKYRSKKHQQSVDESYEELSRKKRKIESELKALDLEEEAARKNEGKKQQKQTSNHHKKRKEPVRIKEEPVRIKEEPVSDDDRHRNARDANRKRKAPKSEARALTFADRNRNRSPTPENEDQDWGNPQAPATEKVKEKPNFATSGKLAEDTNTYNGVVIKYNQPSEARKPKRRWRLYPFKGDSDLPFIPIHRQSAYLFGRTRSIADIPIDHPSCSKQHAVLQFRLVSYKREDGTTGRRVRPYIIDLESSNGTFVNNKRIDPRCYVELIEKDVVKFGYSSREYVILHEESKNDDYDDLQDSN